MPRRVSNHGNGFFHTGFLDADAASPLRSSSRVRFTAAGTYAVVCLIHRS